MRLALNTRGRSPLVATVFMSTGPQTSEYRRKRARVSRACDQCRARKVRCDESQPACTRCVASNAVCTTSDPFGRSVPSDTRRKTQKSSNVPSEPILQSPQVARSTEQEDHRNFSDRSVESLTPIQNHVNSRSNLSSSRLLEDTEQASSDPDLLQPVTIGDGMALNTDNGITRSQYLGPTNVQIMVQWLDLTFAAYGGNQSFSSGFRHGMRHAVEFDLPLFMSIPALPPLETIDRVTANYFTRSNTIFPVLDRHEFATDIAQLVDIADLTQVEDFQRPNLASLFAVLSIGSDEISGATTDEGTRFLQTAYSFLPHLMARPYMPSVQALLLITIALMSRNKEGSAHQILGAALRMAQALGLHRCKHRQDQVEPFTQEQSRRIWWITYCLDKKFSFETGRPGVIQDEDVDQNLLENTLENVNVLPSLVGLAQIQNQISAKLYRVARSRATLSHVLTTIAEIDGALSRWLESVPGDVRPTRDLMCFPPELTFAAMYLSFNYHQVVITLYRPALLFDDKLFQRQLNIADSRNRMPPRLRAGESVCVSSARTTVTLLNDAVQQNTYTRLFSLTQPLLAVYCLAINVIKHPKSWSAPSDLKLMESTSKLLQQLYINSGQDPAFCGMLHDLVVMANQIVLHATEVNRDGHVEPARNHNVLDFADFDFYAGGEFSSFLDQSPAQYMTAEEVSNLFGFPFVGDAFDFSNLLSQ